MSSLSGQVGGGLIVPDVSPIIEAEPGLEREILANTAAMMLVRHRMRKGWQGTEHRHVHEQLVYVIEGLIEITVEGKVHRAKAGDNFIVASNAVHRATALEESIVLDVFTPTREDYLHV